MDTNRDSLDAERLLRRAAEIPAPAAPPEFELLAAAFPELGIEGLLGQGGMSTVYRVRQKSLGRTLALKILAPKLAADPQFTTRFAREAHALAQLDHPRILKVLDFGQRQGFCYLLTEYVDGIDLRRLMAMGRLAPEEALRLCPQLCDALRYAHERGVVHRDIKPENILIDQEGQAKVADFGLARIVDEGPAAPLTRTSQVLGTPHYMAPEQWRSGAVDHRADIFALGVVLYEMLTGQLPLGAFAPPSQQQGVPHGLDAVVRRALAQDPERRYQRVADLERDLRGVGAEAPRAAAGSGSAPSRVRVSRLCRLPLVGMVVFVLVLAAAGMAAWRMHHESVALAVLEQEWARYDADQGARAANERAGREILQVAPRPALPRPPVREPWERGQVGLRQFVWSVPPLAFAVLWGTGIWALSRIRRSRGALHGVGLAVFAVWVTPLVLFDALVLGTLAGIRSDALQRMALGFAVLLLGVLNVWFLQWRTAVARAAIAAVSGPVRDQATEPAATAAMGPSAHRPG
ncbi:MAG: serine/threonine protein kinase [Planctomycetes bacterium]|nr:serine/threonine protein kinase [Planctomycetota bacterium]